MYLNWKERLAYSPELASFSNWPEIPASQIPKRKRPGYLINCRIVTQVLNHQSFDAVGKTIGVSESKISKLMSRCLGGNDEEEPALTNGLIPGTQLVLCERRDALSTFKTPSGAKGSFKKLLKDLPKLEEHLQSILKAHIKDQAHAQNIKPKFFFEAFKLFLQEAHWPKDKYPYTEISLGYESLRKYMHAQLDLMTLKSITSHNPKKIIKAARITKIVFSTVQLDEHTYDVNCSAHLELGDHLKPLRVSRITLIVCVDVASQAVLSYVVVLNRAPNQSDIVECLAGVYQKWSPKALTCPGLQYSPNDGFPCGILYDQDNAPTIGELQLDNALAHIANSVRHYVTSVLFSTYNLGIPGSPKSRNWVEYAFKLLTNDSHRFKSTTGSNPVDPVKESKKNSEKIPVISLQALEETIEVLLAHHNSRRRANLGGTSPLETIEYQLDHVYVPRLTKNQFLETSTPTTTKSVKVKFKPNDKRAPFILYHHLRYTDPCISSPELLHKEVEIHINKNDLRKLLVYKDGVFIGEAFAPKSWQRFPHSYRTRSYIFYLIKNRSIDGDTDPLVNYFNYLLLNKHLPETALEIVRVFREFTHSGAKYIPGNPSVTDLPEPDASYSPNENKYPAWSPELSGI